MRTTAEIEADMELVKNTPFMTSLGECHYLARLQEELLMTIVNGIPTKELEKICDKWRKDNDK